MVEKRPTAAGYGKLADVRSDLPPNLTDARGKTPGER